MTAARLPVVAVVAALSAGCAQQVQFGALEPSATRIELPGQGSEPVQPEQWPDACALLTDEELRAILPAAKEIQRTPSPVEVLDMNVDFLNPRPDYGGTAKRGSCSYSVSHGAEDYVAINVAIDQVAGPATVRAGHEEGFSEALESKTEHGIVKRVDVTGVTGCYRDGTPVYSKLHCHQGRLAFEVGTHTSAEVEGVPDDETDRMVAERIEPLVVRTIVAKL